MAIQTLSQAFNPITGVFGTGQVQFFSASGIWTVPPGIGKVRARVWGGGGYDRGSGGGFSLRTIYDLSGVISVAVTVGAGGISGAATGGTSSFGLYCSATGGATAAGAVGAGSGGNINYSGGLGNGTSLAGGGVAGLFGDGGRAAVTNTSNGGNGCSGGGAGNSTATAGGNGFLGTGAMFQTTPGTFPATSGLSSTFSIDFIGTGGGGANQAPGVNGGGGGSSVASAPGFPGGGGGTTTNGAAGLVIVEW